MEGGIVTPAPALVRFRVFRRPTTANTLVVKNLDLDISQGRVRHHAWAVGLAARPPRS